MNVSKLTCEEVNEALAKFRGEEGKGGQWLPTECEMSSGETIYGFPHFRPGVPIYSHDWRWAGRVLEDMCRPTLSQHNNDDQWSVSYWKDIGDGGAVVRLGLSCDEPTEAVARAGLQMYLEKENHER